METPTKATLDNRRALLAQAAEQSATQRETGAASSHASSLGLCAPGGLTMEDGERYWRYDQNGWRPLEIDHARRSLLAFKSGEGDGADGDLFLRENAVREKERIAGYKEAKAQGKRARAGDADGTRAHRLIDLALRPDRLAPLGHRPGAAQPPRVQAR